MRWQASYRSTLSLKPAAFPTRGGNKEATKRGVCTWVAYPGDVTIALRPKRRCSERAVGTSTGSPELGPLPRTIAGAGAPAGHIVITVTNFPNHKL